MSDIKIGNLPIEKIYLGNTEVTNLFYGNIEVYSAQTPITWTLTDINNNSNKSANENNLNKSSLDYYFGTQSGSSSSSYSYSVSKGNLATTSNSVFWTASGTAYANNRYVLCSKEHNGYIYCIGRQDVSSSTLSIWKINVSTKAVTTITSTSMTSYSTNGNPTFIFVGDYLYIFYAHYNTNSYFDGFYYKKINTTNDTVTGSSLSLGGYSRYFPQCIAQVGNYIYMFDIRYDVNAQSTYRYGYIYKFDTSNDTATKITPELTRKTQNSFAIIGTDIYIGTSNDSDKVMDLYKLDTTTDTLEDILDIDTTGITGSGLRLNYAYNNKLYCSFYMSSAKMYALTLSNIPQITTISFTVGSTSYQAESGMTWYQWCNSSYNVDNYLCGSNSSNVSNGARFVSNGSSYVIGSDIIIENFTYELVSGGGSN